MRERTESRIALSERSARQPTGRRLKHAVQILGMAALMTALISAGCGLHVLAQAQQSGRSSFAYVDEKAGDGRRYRAPKVDADPTDLSIEELRARVSALEERLEQLDAFLRTQQAGRAQTEDRLSRAISSRREGKP